MLKTLLVGGERSGWRCRTLLDGEEVKRLLEIWGISMVSNNFRVVRPKNFKVSLHTLRTSTPFLDHPNLNPGEEGEGGGAQGKGLGRADSAGGEEIWTG